MSEATVDVALRERRWWRGRGGLVLPLTIFLVFVVVVPAFVGDAASTLVPDRILQSPSLSSPLGTDQLGRGVLARALAGLQYTFFIGVAATALAHTVGMPIGLWAATRGGRTEWVLVRLTTVQMSFPPLLFLLIILFTFPAGPITTVVALGANGWMVFARFYRRLGHQISQYGYVAAARGLGASDARLFWRHFLPNAVPSAVPLILVEIGRLMVAEAAISFLGFGIQPPGVSLGIVLAEGRGYLGVAPWIVTAAGLVLMAVVLALSLFANRAKAQPSVPT
jgi:peptide/nickel transport system permease protein